MKYKNYIMKNQKKKINNNQYNKYLLIIINLKEILYKLVMKYGIQLLI